MLQRKPTRVDLKQEDIAELEALRKQQQKQSGEQEQGLDPLLQVSVR
jgi:hypothetical protein